MTLLIEITNESRVRIRQRLPDQNPKARRNEILARLVARARSGGASLKKKAACWARRRLDGGGGPGKCASAGHNFRSFVFCGRPPPLHRLYPRLQQPAPGAA